MSGVVSSTTPVQPKAAIPLADAPAGSNDLPMCVICQHGMRVQEEREALFCGHTFHKFCVSEWRRCAGRTSSECPLRCRHPNHAVAAAGGDDDWNEMEVDEEQHDSEPVAPAAPPQDPQAATEEVAQAGFGEPEPQQ